MLEIKDQQTIASLLEQLSRKIQEFDKSLEEDKIFEIGRTILKDIRTPEKELALMKQEEHNGGYSF